MDGKEKKERAREGKEKGKTKRGAFYFTHKGKKT
jgi:hypothetical protein